MRLLHHHDHPRGDVEPARQAAGATSTAAGDPVAAAVWRRGLAGAPAAGTLVIHAPHASELVEAPSARSDAA